MYNYEWDKITRGYRLTSQTGKFVASEIRPVFAPELDILGFDKYFKYDKNEKNPIMWAKHTSYYYEGNEIAKISDAMLGKTPQVTFLAKAQKLKPVNIEAMVVKNKAVMDALVSNTLKRIKEMYDQYSLVQDIVYIAFSGGKDSVLLLDLCDRVLPKNIPVIFSDTTMELPETYEMWEQIQARYPERAFLKFSTQVDALENWRLFGPPSRTLDWCCSVHKSAPAILALKKHLGCTSLRATAFVGVRGDESLKRDSYDGDVGEGVKNASQINTMPIYEWGTHELFLYYFKHNLPLHPAYLKGVPRIGCILCPKASNKYAWFVEKAYPAITGKYVQTIIDTSTKNFESQDEIDDYIATSGWQARRNGLEIKCRILPPTEKSNNNSIEWGQFNAPRDALYQWLKTIGLVTISEDSCVIEVKCARGDAKDNFVRIEQDVKDNVVTKWHAHIEADTPLKKKNLKTQLKKVLLKSIACVSCRACEAECSFGALNITPDGVKIDEAKCVHCLHCHNIDYGCWRYKSMMIPTSSDSPLKSIANYQNFGLRQTWIQVYCDEGASFVENTTLGGGPMIDSARIWFKQALLTKDDQTIEPGKIMQIPLAFGIDSELFWSLIWIALCNYSPLIKWFAVMMPYEIEVSVDELTEKLGDLSASTKRGGMQALWNFLKNNPLGVGEQSLFTLNKKGARVLGVKRTAVAVEPMAILYSLYVMAKVSGRTSFTLSEMKNADIESPFISPIVAFGVDMERMKAQCMGIATRYPEFLSCSFALGLDEIKVFPDKKTLDDVVGLILGE